MDTTAGPSAKDFSSTNYDGHVERLVFERLLADLSTRFANVSSDRIVAELEAALGQLVESLGYDRCTYSELTADGALRIVSSAAIGGIEPLPVGPFGTRLPWLVGEIRAGRIVALANLPRGLPPEAVAEAERVLHIGLRSHLSIPLRVGGRVVAALSFAGFRDARSWPEEVITRLTIIGEVLASAVARARFEEEAQQLRRRLWHADRVARTGALTAAIAHELNQPLAAILNNAQAALRYLDRGGMMREEMRAILEAIVRDDKRAAETIRGMRALLRRDQTGRERIDVAATLRGVLQLLAGELDRQGIRIETELEEGCRVLAERVQIEQVALNLILNAAAAMRGGARDRRRLRLAVRRTDRGRIAVAVSDSGVGIEPEVLDRAFEPFWTTRREGLGLGLAICRAIIEAHGGAISVAPNPDCGVTFRFELDAAQVDNDAARAATGPATAAPPAFARAADGAPVVCVVDDDSAARESIGRLLTAAGCKVTCYASALELADRPLLADVACLVLDNRMPGMSGLELCEHLAAGDAAPPVVFLTGSEDVATGVEAMKLGAVDFLVKPVDGEVLLAVVGRALERHADARKQTLERDASRALVGRLSVREREVTAHVIRGRLNKQIAADLDISEQTVKQHRGRVMEKLEVRSVPELLRVCERSGLFAGAGGTGARATARGDDDLQLRR